MLCKGAIIPTDNEPDQLILIYLLFLNPMENLDLSSIKKKLNMFVRQEHFKQETFNVVLDLKIFSHHWIFAMHTRAVQI